MPKCQCGEEMIFISGIGKIIQTGEIDDDGLWKQTGMEELSLYQCSSCKTIIVE